MRASSTFALAFVVGGALVGCQIGLTQKLCNRVAGNVSSRQESDIMQQTSQIRGLWMVVVATPTEVPRGMRSGD